MRPIAGLVAGLLCLVAAGCAIAPQPRAAVSGATTPTGPATAAVAPGSSASSASELVTGAPAPGSERVGAPPRKVVGIENGDLVVYDTKTHTSQPLVRGVNTSGVLAMRPGSPWIAIARLRRWDALDVTDIALVNLATKRTWHLSRQVGGEIHVQPLGWSKEGLVFAPDPAYSGDTTGARVIDLQNGVVSATSPSHVVAAWTPQSRTWRGPLTVPSPMVGGKRLADGFWSLGAADVSPNGEWAVVWLQPSWPAPIDGGKTYTPIYLLARDGRSVELPLERPTVFLTSLTR